MQQLATSHITEVCKVLFRRSKGTHELEQLDGRDDLVHQLVQRWPSGKVTAERVAQILAELVRTLRFFASSLLQCSPLTCDEALQVPPKELVLPAKRTAKAKLIEKRASRPRNAKVRAGLQVTIVCLWPASQLPMVPVLHRRAALQFTPKTKASAKTEATTTATMPTMASAETMASAKTKAKTTTAKTTTMTAWMPTKATMPTTSTATMPTSSARRRLTRASTWTPCSPP